MSIMKLYSEPFAKTGNMAAEGFRRLLGRPALSLLQTLLRESIQNVLDAATSPIGPSLLIRLRTLTAEQKACLRRNVFAELPKGDSTRDELESSLSRRTLKVLEICDFGTEGLSGPTRADAPHDGHEPLNFVNFLRNVGAARDTHQGGGTYGYGKSSLYAMSACSAILVDSQTRCGGAPIRRLMACHLGAAFDGPPSEKVRRRYTGRHWWGALDGKDSVEPIVGTVAESVSTSIGLPARDEATTGTSILILDPSFGDGELTSVADDIVESVLWNFWPRMCASTPSRRRLSVHLEIEGEQIIVPAPEEFPPLDLFAEAMASHRSGSEALKPITCGRPVRRLGALSVAKGLCTPRRGAAARGVSLIPGQVSHIAVMRPIELVVKYIEGEPFADQRFEWAGVFICSDDADIEAAFALAEPPAHDDWVPDNLPKGQERTFVNVALKRLKELAAGHGSPPQVDVRPGNKTPSLAATATKMGGFLDRVSARGPGRDPRPRPGPGQRNPLGISVPVFMGLQLDGEGRPVARFSAELRNDQLDKKLQVSAHPYLALDGGAAASSDLPEGFEPRVLTIQMDGLRSSSDSSVLVVGHSEGTIEVLVSTVQNAAVGLQLRLSGGTTQ